MNPAPGEARDWCSLPLEDGGRSLIEASAGTGKTWTITVLYLRLLLERQLSPRQVVVTTFTDAAAQELRERLRARLHWARRQAGVDVAAGGAGAAGDLDWLRRRWAGADGPALRAADCSRLSLALAELDLAPVGTLHGLCRRILADYPFECGEAFAPAELVGAGALDAELLDDLWRTLSQSGTTPAPGDRLWLEGGRRALSAALRKVTAPGIDVRTIDCDADAGPLDAGDASALRALVGDGSRFQRSTSVLARALLELADFLGAGDLFAELPPQLAENLAKPLDRQVRPEYLDATGNDPLLHRARAFVPWLRRRRAAVRATALSRYRRELLAQREQRLRSRGQLVFDSLLSRVHAALHAPGSALPALLRQAWPVAMVDEFQDTDAQQFGILDRIYRDPGGGPGGRLVMIGDPKQAIYRFRGGDIHAYGSARRSAGDHLQLQVNFRSSRRYLEALNALFAAAGPVLGQDPAGAIRVDPVLPGPDADAAPFRQGELPCRQPLVIHLDPTPPASQPERCEAALVGCANQIVRMLADPALRIGDQPLRPGDFAVLVPKNHQVARLRTLLQARGVPCVGAGRSSVFATDCARELQVLLYGIEHHGDPAAVRAALATRLYGLDFAALRALDGDTLAWQQHHQRLLRWRSEWQRGGVLALLRAMFAHGAERLRAGADAERLLTDLRHLGELLQDAGERLGGPAALLDWLQRQREGDDEAADAEVEEQQLRIESDARRVRLMTLHAAKGLEFPLVMLPLMWAHEGRDCPLPLWRDGAGRRWLDLGSDEIEAVRRREQQDDQEERFRVLYVALTRARHGCHLFALPHQRPQNGTRRQPPGDPSRSALDALLERIGPHADSAAGAADAPIEWQVGPWPVGLERYRAGQDGAPATGAARPEPPGAPYRQRYSFSALAQGHAAGLREEEAADDEVAVDPAQDAAADLGDTEPGLLALAGWRGIEFGNAVHSMLERREPGRLLVEQPALVRGCLGPVLRAGEDLDAAAAAIAARLDAVLGAELLPGLRLAALAPAAARAELEFHFALGDVSMRGLREACAAFGQPELVPASNRTLRGYMTGKIDLVLQHGGRFHVLDYKGNWLGGRLADYRGDALARAMDAHHYRFQALLYSIALARYLRQRLPGVGADAVGEAIHVFVRAVGLAPAAGIWRERFDPRLLAAVDAALAGESRVAA